MTDKDRFFQTVASLCVQPWDGQQRCDVVLLLLVAPQAAVEVSRVEVGQVEAGLEEVDGAHVEHVLEEKRD